MLHVALHVHLRLLAVGRRRQGDNPKDPRADPLGDRLDGAAFAGGVAAFEDNDDAQALVLHPILELTELYLELAELLFNLFAPVGSFSGGARFFVVFHKTQ